LIALVLEPFIVPIKADPQALACPNINQDNEYVFMPTKDVRSYDYAPGTTSSEEWSFYTSLTSFLCKGNEVVNKYINLLQWLSDSWNTWILSCWDWKSDCGGSIQKWHICSGKVMLAAKPSRQ
jgi:hypothetical protein